MDLGRNSLAEYRCLLPLWCLRVSGLLPQLPDGFDESFYGVEVKLMLPSDRVSEAPVHGSCQFTLMEPQLTSMLPSLVCFRSNRADYPICHAGH